MLKSFLLIFALVLLAVVIVPVLNLGAQQSAPTPALTPDTAAAPPAQAAPVMKNPVKPTADSQAKAKSIYGIDCAICHGDNGNGKTDVATSNNYTLDDWTDSKTLAAKQDGDLFNIIRNGKGQMPAEGEGRAKDAEVWNLVIYIRSFSKAQAAAAK